MSRKIISGSTITIELNNKQKVQIDLKDLHPDIVQRLALHGLAYKLGTDTNTPLKAKMLLKGFWNLTPYLNGEK